MGLGSNAPVEEGGPGRCGVVDGNIGTGFQEQCTVPSSLQQGMQCPTSLSSTLGSVLVGKVLEVDSFAATSEHLPIGLSLSLGTGLEAKMEQARSKMLWIMECVGS